MYRTEEYSHLLLAQRTLVKSLEAPTKEAREQAQIALALVRVIDQKRIMRGQPAPKAREVERKTGKGKASMMSDSLDLPGDSPAAPAPESKPSD